MSDIPRRTIDDLVARYELEPELHDIIVEGQIDREIITRSLSSIGQSSRIVYEIDTIDVPDEKLTQHGFSTGNKQRVIVLAHETAHLPDNCEFRCLVDRDLDHWLGTMTQIKRLLWTDYCALEHYFFSDELLQDILFTTAKCKIKNWVDYIESMIVALRSLYILRLADQELGLNLSWLPIGTCLSLKKDLVHFDTSEYATRLLNKNSKSNALTDFTICIKKWNKKVIGDHRLHTHGHDFVKMIAWSITQTKGLKSFATEDAITRILVLLSSRAKGIAEVLN